MPIEPVTPQVQKADSSDAVDLKKMELNVRVVRSLAQYFELRFGRPALEELLARTGLSFAYLQDETNWVSMAYRDRLIREMTDYSKDRRFAYKAGCFTVSEEAIGFGYAFMASFSTPAALYKKLFDLAAHFNRVGSFQILELTDGSLTCIYQPISDEYMDDELGNEFRLGQLVAFPRVCGLPDADCKWEIIEKDGRKAFHYVFTWQEKTRALDPIVGAILGLLLGNIINLLTEMGTLVFVVGWVLLGGALGWMRVLYHRTKHLAEAVNRQQEEISQADDALVRRYNALLQAYQENQSLTRNLEVKNAELVETNRALVAAKEDIQEFNAALEVKNAELVDANRALLAAKEDIQNFNNTLQAKVDAQTRELKVKNEELAAALNKAEVMDRIKSQFFARINHELRTPLTLILTPMESMLNDPDHLLPAPHRQLLDTMRRNGLRLLKLINSLLDLVKSAEGEMRLRYESVDLNQLLSAIVEQVRPSTTRHGLELRRSLQEGLPPVMLDAEKIEGAIFNLLSNAVKFTPAGGLIEVSTTLVDREVQIRVRDTGHGIPAASIPNIFDRFADAGTEAVRGFGGTGIGLSLVKEFVQLHNGQVDVESEVGVGTTFIIRLPYGEGTVRPELWERRRTGGPPQAPMNRRGGDENIRRAISDYVTNVQEINLNEFKRLEQESGREETPRLHGRATVLVVDDDVDMLFLLTAVLRNEYNILTASDAFEGEALARTEQPDLILSDVKMSTKDGYRMVADLKADPRTSQIPIILMSAHADDDHRIRGIEGGAYDYVAKPFNTRELMARIRSNILLHDTLLKLQDANRELEARNHRITQLSITDQLTGVYNRRHMDEELRKAFALASATGGLLAAVMLDIDFFKRFNSRYGHAGGDIVLHEVAKELQRWFEGFGTTARYGGEEFAVLLPNMDTAGALQRAELFRRHIEASRFGPTREWAVTVSMGVGAFPECDVLDADELLRVADNALVRAKTRRNCCEAAPRGDSARSVIELEPSDGSSSSTSGGWEPTPRT